MLVSGTTEKARVSTIIMDEDSTTMAKIKKICGTWGNQREWHKSCQKIVGNDLYALQKKHRILSSKVISYPQKCFYYAVKQHKNDQILKKASIQNTYNYTLL